MGEPTRRRTMPLTLSRGGEPMTDIAPPDANALARGYGRAVYLAAYRVLGDASQAEDVQQDVFLRLIEKPPTDVASWPAYLTAMATRQAIDRLRSRQRWRRLRPLWKAAEPVAADTAEEEAAQTERTAAAGRSGPAQATTCRVLRAAVHPWPRHCSDRSRHRSHPQPRRRMPAPGRADAGIPAQRPGAPRAGGAVMEPILSPTLTRHLRALACDPPVAALDAAQARLERRLADARPRNTRPARWIGALATAATACLVLTLVLMPTSRTVAFDVALKHLRDFHTLALTIEQQSQGMAMPTIRVRMDRSGDARTDIGDATSVVVNAAEHRVLTLLHGPRMALVTLLPANAKPTPDAALKWLDAIRQFQGKAV